MSHLLLEKFSKHHKINIARRNLNLYIFKLYISLSIFHFGFIFHIISQERSPEFWHSIENFMKQQNVDNKIYDNISDHSED